MTDKAKLVLKGLLSLTESDRQEVLKEEISYRAKDYSEKRVVNEALQKAEKYLGPTSDAKCACCGR